MKRAALFFFLSFAVPAVMLADGVTRRMIVGTRQPALNALQQLRSDEFDPTNRVRYDVVAFRYINAFVADLDETEIAALKKNPAVEYIEEDPERHILADSITPGQQTTPYGVNLVQAPQAWPITRGRSLDPSKPIRVAIIDTGIDYNTPELADAFKGGIDIVNGDNDPLDDDGHGTHVAGIIAAADNGTGVVGVAPQAELYSAKVLDSCGSGRGSDVIAAVEWVRDQKKKIGGNWIINLSLGSDTPSTPERSAFQGASDDGILVFAASGNDFPNTTGLSFPAGYPTVVSVGAIDDASTVASFSQRGSGLKVVAPGVLNLSTFISPRLRADDGRSFTATLPLVATAAGKTLCPSPALSGTTVFCGFGASATDFPTTVTGKIALISRGNAPGAGSIATKSGSTQVTGTGTSFLADVHAGDSINICSQAQFTVASVTNNTTLTLTSAALPSATASGLNYTVGLTFLTKAKNAKSAGASGVIVFNHDVCGGTPVEITPSLTVISLSDIPPFLFVSEADGLSLKDTPSATLTFAFDNHGFALLSGTSMASPHAVGVAALAWSVAPSLKNTDIADAMEKTAIDLGDAGVDNTYGFGMVNAKAVVDMLSASNPVQPLTPTGRFPGRRGH
jgi:subtilisin